MFRKIRLEEALARVKARAGRDVRNDLIDALFPGRARSTQIANFNNLLSGRTRTFDAETVVTICKMCDVSADWLFGLAD